MPAYGSKEGKSSLWCDSKAQKKSCGPSSPSESLPEDHPCACLTWCLLFLPLRAMTLNPLFTLLNQGWDTDRDLNSMMALLGEKASREGQQQRQSLLKAQQLPHPGAQLGAMPSWGATRGPQLPTVTQPQDNRTPTFLGQLLTKGFNHSRKWIQGQTGLEIKIKKKKLKRRIISDQLFMRHFNSIIRTSTERDKSRIPFQNNSLHRGGSAGHLGTTLQYHRSLDQNANFHPFLQRQLTEILCCETQDTKMPHID